MRTPSVRCRVMYNRDFPIGFAAVRSATGLLFLSAMVCGLSGRPAYAQNATLQEYTVAKSQKGCRSIPYSDLREKCEKFGDFVTQECKSPGGFSCEDLKTKSLVEVIKGIESSITELKKQRDEEDSKRTNASSDSEKSDHESKVKDLTSKIEEKEKLLEDRKTTLKTDQSDAGIREEMGGRCLEARHDVQTVFDEAGSHAKSESDPAKQPIAADLILDWDAGQRDHADIVRDTKAAIEMCRKAKNGDL